MSGRGPSALLGIRKHPLFREFLGFGSTTLLEQASRTTIGLVAAGQLGPVVWGSWYLLNLVLRYGALTHLGVLNGMNRQYPLELGRGHQAEARELRRASLGFLLLSFVAVAVLVTVGGLGLPALPMRALLLTTGLLACQQAFTFGITSLKAETRFGEVSRTQLASSLLQPLTSLPMMWAWGLDGFIAGQATAYALVTLFIAVRQPTLFEVRLDFERSRRLIRIGLPIMFVGVLYALFTTVDRWVIATTLDTKSLGHYSLAIMALGAVSLLPLVVAQQYYPRMSRAWGEAQDWRALAGMARRQGWSAFVSTLPPVLLGWLLAPPVIRAWLPAYVPGIASLMIVLAAPLFLSFGQGYANVLNVTDNQYRYLSLIAGSIVLNAVVSLLLVRSLGLPGVAIGTLIAYGAFSLGLVAVGRRVVARGQPKGT